MKKNAILLCLLLGFQLVIAQNDTIQLQEANLADNFLLRFTETQSKMILSDSVLEKNGVSLTSALNYNSVIYFKENGSGMVASPSFRGTTAQQTAVVWNGININSQFLGQTDFNTVNTGVFDNIIIKPGGGSIAYGSGAMGGSIHLNNDLVFNNEMTNRLRANYGSFNSYGLNFSSQYSNEKLSFNAGIGRSGSDNDFEIHPAGQRNKNGRFYNHQISLASAYKINRRNMIKFYENIADGERHFSLILPTMTPTKYHDYNTRSLIEWDGSYGKFISRLKLAYLGEEYRYYPHIDSDNPTFGKADSWITKYDLGFNFNRKLFFNVILDYTYSEGNGSDELSGKRKVGSASFLMKHRLSSRFVYEASIRQELTDSYKAPFLYAFGMKWDATDFYQIKLNASKNFRMPTFNDLFWPGSGNPDLRPETSYQAEIGNELKLKNFSFGVTGYYNSVKNLIRWIPTSGGNTVPENTANVEIYGLESILHYTKSFSKHRFELNGTYAYTISENKETGKQLIYVPFHKATASLGYSWKHFSAYYQFLFNGEVFTSSDNDPKYNVSSYSLSNMGLEYGFGKSKSYRLGIQVLNLYDEVYQSVLDYPMPGRNFNLYINLNF